MNTIYDNTFVLGQTSATNFIAGNGIRIDEPSEGTVRIGTDETVLFENVTGASANITLSESLSSFNTCKIFAFPYELTTNSLFVEEWPGDSTRFGIARWVYHGGIANYPYVLYTTRYDVSNNTFVFGRCNHTWFTPAFAAAGTATNSPIMITKVIGINRISGGNE